MAYIHAEKESFPNLKEKLPSGTIWASPGKEDGYLRVSILQKLAERVGDAPLPQDLLNAGAFAETEQETGTSVKERMVSLELAQKLRQALKEMRLLHRRELPARDDEDDESDEED
jgi:hypothetical protein